MAAPGPDAGPVGHRDTPFSVIVDQRTPALAESLDPHGTGATFLNFLADSTRVRAAYTAADHARLTAVKKTYDPGNVFRLNHNIAPR